MNLFRKLINKMNDYYELYKFDVLSSSVKLKDKPKEFWISLLDKIEFEDNCDLNNKIAKAIIDRICVEYTQIKLKYSGIITPDIYCIDVLDKNRIVKFISRGSVYLGSFANSYSYTINYTPVSISWIKYLIENIEEYEKISKIEYISKSEEKIKELYKSIEKIKSNIE